MTAALVMLLAALLAQVWRGRDVRRVLARDPETESELAGVADLLAAAVAAGGSVPGALRSVGRAVGGDGGRALERAGNALVGGRHWSEAWAGAPARLEPLERALADAWHSGAAPVPVLRHLAAGARRARRELAAQAAGRLGVRLVLPLGLCLLPAFVLLGIVPLVLSLGAGLLGGP